MVAALVSKVFLLIILAVVITVITATLWFVADGFLAASV